jgi:hypothetical protein
MKSFPHPERRREAVQSKDQVRNAIAADPRTRLKRRVSNEVV